MEVSANADDDFCLTNCFKFYSDEFFEKSNEKVARYALCWEIASNTRNIPVFKS